MDIKLLRYFLAVVQEENISRAAEALFITQPTLIRQMAQLEEELGVQLFERGRRLVLTDAGVALRQRAEDVVVLMDKIKADFADRQNVAGIISIGMGGLLAAQQILDLSEAFQRDYPQVQFRFYSDNADDIKEKLDAGLLDFGVLLEPVEMARYDYLRFHTEERWGVLMPSENPLAAKNAITPQDLDGLPLMVSDRQALQKELNHWLQAGNIQPNIVATYNLITHTAALVDSGYAYALTIEGAITLLDKNRLAFRPLFPELAMTSVLAWKKTRADFGAAAKFLQFVKEKLQAV
ncbi:DNA-binding transcriptional LysR family regulator [Cricetibacter osteomyelitidis]|uniref:DNA-binding transcriptional LysR family regulator n=1 Tax=Cricetibacter osteomyelitidis TaxID=1521931 RepID=A0A4R2T1I2_9PAST|nr:LysR family transcriptional regulator [Cricetibacter osteomyelitidis]TCP95990.1 DNA-binding transcriptional LysR family regulator [Cricetibacter osteomyelitidis]